MISLNMLKDLLPHCCEVDAISIAELSDDEREHLAEYLPDFKSVIVMVHHIKHALEWTWFSFESSRNDIISPADLHLEAEAQNLIKNLEKCGYNNSVIPYPGKVGIRFKELANKTGLGKIGDNYLFLHKKWGAWTHIRILITNTEITDCMEPCNEICIHCEACKNACPVNAIQNDELLGNECSDYQQTLSNSNNNYECKCEICMRACPIGTAPKAIHIL